MGSALPVLVQSGNLSFEIWSSDGCQLNYNATIETAFVLMPTGTGETEESLLPCASGRRPPARQCFRQGRRSDVSAYPGDNRGFQLGPRGEAIAHNHAHSHDEHHRHAYGPNDPVGEPFRATAMQTWREPDVPGDLLRALFGTMTEPT
jgi:hypothetical protein